MGVVLSVDGQDLPPPAGPLIPEKERPPDQLTIAEEDTCIQLFLSQKARTLEQSPHKAPPTRRNRCNQRNN